MTEPLRMTDPGVLALRVHMVGCAACQAGMTGCPSARALTAPLVQQLSDWIVEYAADRVYADICRLEAEE